MLGLVVLGGCWNRASESARNRGKVDAPRLDMAHPTLTVSNSPADAGVGLLAPQVTGEPTTQIRSECAEFVMPPRPCDGQRNLRESLEVVRAAQRAGKPQCAWRLIGVAACENGDTKLADDAYRRLNPQNRDYLVYVCGREGIRLVKGHFRIVED